MATPAAVLSVLVQAAGVERTQRQIRDLHGTLEKSNSTLATMDRQNRSTSSSVAGLGGAMRAFSTGAAAAGDSASRLGTHVSNLDNSARRSSGSVGGLSGLLSTLGIRAVGAGNGVDAARTKTERFNMSMMGLRNIISILKWPAMIAGVGYAAQAIGTLTAAVAGLIGALGPLTGAMAGVASMYLSAGQAFGVVKLAFNDVGKALSGNKKALESLTPAQQQFVQQLQGMKGQMKDLRNTAAQGMLPGVAQGLQSMMPLFPRLKAVVASTASTMGGLAAQGGAMVANWGPAITSIGNTNVQIIRNMGSAGLFMASAFKNLLVAAGPLSTWMSAMVLKGAQFINTQIAAAQASGRLASFFDKTKEVMITLGHIIGNLGVALFNIFKGAAPLGNQLLGSFEQLTKRFRDWTASAAGQNSIRKFFEDAKPAVYAMFDLIGKIGKVFGPLFKPDAGTAKAFQMIGSALQPIATMIKTTTANLGPAFLGALSNVAKLFAAIAGSSGPLVLAISAIGWVAGKLAQLVGNNPALQTMATTVFGLGGAYKLMKLAFMPFVALLKPFGPLVNMVSRALWGMNLASTTTWKNWAKAAWGTAAEQMKRLAGWVKATFTADAVKNAASMAASWAGIGGKGGAAKGAAKAGTTAAESAGAGAAGGGITGVLGKIGKPVVSVLTGVGTAFAAIGVGAAAAVGAVVAVIGALAWLYNTAKGPVKAIAGYFLMLASPIVFVVSTIVQNFDKIVAALVAVGKAIWAAITWLFNLFVTAVKAQFAIIWAAATWVWSSIVAALTGIWNTLVATVTWIFNAVVTVITAVWGVIWSAATFVWNAISSALSAAWNAIWSAVTWVFNAVVGVITSVWAAIWSAAMFVWNAITSALSAAWNAIWTAITWVFNTVVGVIKSVWGAIWSAATFVWNAITSAVSAAWNGIWSAITWVFNAVVGVIRSVWNAIWSAALAVWNAIGSALSAAWNVISKAVTWVFSQIVNIIKSTWNTFWNLGKSLFEAVWSGMKWVINQILKGIWWFIGKIVGAINAIPIVPDIKFDASKPPQLAKGGVVGYAKGGMVAAQRGMRVNRPMAIVGEEAPAHPEYVIPTNPRYRNRAVDLLSQAAGAVGAFQEGGVVAASTYDSPQTYPGFAELSNPPESHNWSALGNLQRGAIINVQYHNKTVQIPKIDVGAGGAGIGQYIRAIDLNQAAAAQLAFSGLDLVKWWPGVGAALGAGAATGIPALSELMGKLPKGAPDMGIGEKALKWIGPLFTGLLKSAKNFITKKIGDMLKAIGGGPGPSPMSGKPAVDNMIAAANWITDRRYPYVWGGGHNAGFTGPYDCSGAVSAVLHAAGLLGSPLTSGGLMNWGEGGPGQWVTVWADAGHTFMSLMGRFFGTSVSNPAGGAGWYAGAPDPGKAVRHPPGLAEGGALGSDGAVGSDRALQTIPEPLRSRARRDVLANPKAILPGLAAGGIAKGWAVVGEAGPELVRLPVASKVYSNQQSNAMLRTPPPPPQSTGAGTIVHDVRYQGGPLSATEYKRFIEFYQNVWNRLSKMGAFPSRARFPGIHIDAPAEGIVRPYARMFGGGVHFTPYVARLAMGQVPAAGVSLMNWARMAMVHELAHGNQSRKTLSSQTLTEGGAQAWTNLFGGYVLPYGYRSPGNGSYQGYVDWVWKNKGDNWIRHGQWFAKGGKVAQTGMAVVGERGPELVQLPVGTQVYSNTRSKAMLAQAARLGVPGYQYGGTIEEAIGLPPLPAVPSGWGLHAGSAAKTQKFVDQALQLVAKLKGDSETLDARSTVLSSYFSAIGSSVSPSTGEIDQVALGQKVAQADELIRIAQEAYDIWSRIVAWYQQILEIYDRVLIWNAQFNLKWWSQHPAQTTAGKKARAKDVANTQAALKKYQDARAEVAGSFTDAKGARTDRWIKLLQQQREKQDIYQTTPGRGTTTDTSGAIAAAEKQATEMAQRLAVSQAQYQVLQGFNLPMMQAGGAVARSGWAIVGERGPEPVHLPTGARVYPNGSSTPNADVRVVMEDHRTRVFVNGEEQAVQVTRRMARQAGRGLPGAGGSW